MLSSALSSMLALGLSTPAPASPSPLAERFNAMMNAVVLPPSALLCIDDERKRVLLTGVSAAASNEAVRQAFICVYEDLGPARVAGDMIFSDLSKAAAAAAAVEQTIVGLSEERAAEAEADRLQAVTNARRLFETLDADGTNALDANELLANPQLLELFRRAELGETPEAAAARLVEAADRDGDGRISFAEFALVAAAQPEACASAIASACSAACEGSEGCEDACADVMCDPPPATTASARFDEMLVTFQGWEAEWGGKPGEGEGTTGSDGSEPDGRLASVTTSVTTSEPEGRLATILKGCFVGARLPPVVAALKACYEGWLLLRFGGDLIFMLMKRYVEGEARRK
jgi:hypothetical protein